MLAPSLKRRFACLFYESFLACAWAFLAAALFEGLWMILQKNQGLYFRVAYQLWLFFMLGLYFVLCWCRGGQTLPMKTWRIRLVTVTGEKLTLFRALWRYLLAWGWVLPGLILASWLAASLAICFVFVAVNILLWVASVFLIKENNFYMTFWQERN